jgi:hypothetical protein
VRTAPTVNVTAYLDRLNSAGNRAFSFTGHESQSVEEWQTRARPALRKLIGLTGMNEQLQGHVVSVELEPAEDMGDYSRQLGRMETEPDVWIPFWLLRPGGEGPFPLAITPHGHDSNGYNTSVGIPSERMPAEKIQEEDRDVAVQAVRRGFMAIAPATRGLSCDGVPDIYNKHGGRDCRSQLMHCLMVNRTCVGERVYDMERFLDWAVQSFEVDESRVLMMGNSGGGVVTTYAAACDERITVAVPSCSFDLLQARGCIMHCDCNLVPGILHFGEFYDVAGLIAPRRLLIVNGRHDSLHRPAEVDQAAEKVAHIYEAAGASANFSHQFGEEGHRFYKDIMWPFIEQARCPA